MQFTFVILSNRRQYNEGNYNNVEDEEILIYSAIETQVSDRETAVLPPRAFGYVMRKNDRPNNGTSTID